MTSPPLDTGARAMPAVHAADERTTLTGMLEWYREGVVLKVGGMDQVAAATAALRSGTTAAGLVKHLALVEDSWFTDRLAGRGEPEPWASAPFEQDVDWEFHSANEQPLASSVELYAAACDRSREVAAGIGLEGTRPSAPTRARWPGRASSAHAETMAVDAASRATMTSPPAISGMPAGPLRRGVVRGLSADLR